MYDSLSKVEVFIRPVGSKTPYAEYATLNPRHKYIEATADERYEVVAVLHDRYQSPGCGVAYSTCYIENGAVISRKWCPLPRSRDDGEKFEIVHSSRVLDLNGAWREVGFASRKMQIDSKLKMSEEDEATQLQIRGKVTIAIRLGKSVVEEELIELPARFVDRTPRATSAKLAVDHGKSHCLKPVDIGPAQPPKTNFMFRACQNDRENHWFSFFLTSREFLLKNGFDVKPKAAIPAILAVPQTPSRGSKRARPTPALSAPTDDTDDDADLEVITPRKTPRTRPPLRGTEQAAAGSQSGLHNNPPVVRDRTTPNPSPSITIGSSAMGFTPSSNSEDTRGAAASPSSTASFSALTPSTQTSSTTGAKPAVGTSRRKKLLEIKLKRLEIEQELLEMELEEGGE